MALALAVSFSAVRHLNKTNGYVQRVPQHGACAGVAARATGAEGERCVREAEAWCLLLREPHSIVSYFERNGHRFILAQFGQAPTPVRPLTQREQQIAEYLAQGLSNKLVGLELGISPPTVSVHVQSIRRKLGVSSRVALVKTLCARGLPALFPASPKLRTLENHDTWLSDSVPVDLQVVETEIDGQRGLIYHYSTNAAAAATGNEYDLTPALADVAAMLLDGLTYEDIAAQRRRSKATVTKQVEQLYRRLNVHSRAELAVLIVARATDDIG